MGITHLQRNKIKKTLIFLPVLFFTFSSFSQDLPQLPYGTCGIVNIYDPGGNRTKRVYFCNNGQQYPQKSSIDPSAEITEKNETVQFQYVDALFPNPTSGKFSITFSKNLEDAEITLMDNSGKMLARCKGKGNRADFDLSGRPAGVYFVRVEEKGKTITKKVVKQ